ncbi:DUF1330 domain-containing protein [Alphaproteobacteria bacterium]|nr:DUF1330 domain-containing protein [Alphaproteobacteria bacterium]
MTAYLISFSNQHSDNPDWRSQYLQIVNPLLKKHNGEIISRGSPEVMERGQNWEKATLIQFPSSEQAKSFMNDPDYHHAKGLRIFHTNGALYLLEPDKQ